MKTSLHRAFSNACLLMAVFLATSVMSGQVTLPGTSPYSENFNTTPGASGTAYPTGWASYNGAAVDNAMTTGNNTSTTGANYNYGSRIGILGSGSNFSPASLVLRIANTTGKTGLKISYDVVKIREQARSNSFDLEISTTSATTGFTSVSGGTYASGTIAEGTASAYTNLNLSALDNISANVWIRWSYAEISGSGSRDGIALDNVVLSWGPTAPAVTTVAANTITANSAVLRGTINANSQTVAASFNWGTTTSYGSNAVATPSSVTGTTLTNISASLGSLSPNTQYNFRAVGTVSGTPANGANANFYTLANVPGVLTVDNPTISTLDVTVTTATQNGNPSATTYAIRETTSGNYIQSGGSLGATAVWRTAAAWATVTVTGLDDDTPYTFSAKARNAAVTPVETAFGATATESTLLNTDPTLTAASLAGFGAVCIETASNENSFTLDGINLTSGDITVGPLAGYSFSTTEGGPYSTTLVITPVGATLTQEIFVVLEPTAVASYNGNISISGAGAPAINVAATGSGINTPSSVTTVAAAALTASTAEVDAEVTSEGCSTVTERGVVYSTLPNPLIGGSGVIQVPDTTSGAGTYTISITSLDGATMYYVKAYSINDGGTSYGTALTFTTDDVIAPVATAATDVEDTSFTANWNASEGAVSYRLDVSTSPTFGTSTPASDLFFSEYVEGSSTNKYLEIYNGTGVSANLSDYKVRLYSNGSSTAAGVNDVQLSGTLANGATIVLKNTTATIYSGTATTVSSVNFNGNDAVALYKISTTSNVDIIGSIGDDPGSAWTSASNSTVDKTLVRKSSVTGGVTVSPVSGFPTLEAEWDEFNQNDVAHLGSHTYAGNAPSFLPGYENLTVTGTSQTVTGLTIDTNYYYRVRAVAGNTSGNSNVITVTTVESTDPALSVTSPDDFGGICVDTVSEPKQITVSGVNLTDDDVIVGPAEGFSFSTEEDGDYFDSLTLIQSGGTFSQDIFVRFEPAFVSLYNFDLEVNGGGAAETAFGLLSGEGVDSPPTVIIADAEGLTATTAEVNAEVTAQGCSGVIQRGIVYSLSADPEIDGVGVTQVVDGLAEVGSYTTNLEGLSAGTLYYVRAYAINNGGVSYSATATFTTEDVAAPLATDATGVTDSSFTATWEASEGAVSYKLDVSESATFGTSTPTTDLFFSEYAEGSSTNKYLEIYNGTGITVDLSDYKVRLYSNGSAAAVGTNDVQLSGMLANGATVVLKNSTATLYGGAATTISSVNFSGDDAVALFRISTNANVDIIGRIGEDPGTAWTSTSSTTIDKTLVRKSSVTGGVTVNPGSGFPTLETEWDEFNQNDITHLGAHSYAGFAPSFVSGYEDLTVASGTSQEVTGLAANTAYYYRVRAVAGNTSGNSNVVNVTTEAGGMMRPALSAPSFENNVNKVVVYKQNGVLNIGSSDAAIKSVVVYDVTGKLLFSSGAFNERNVILQNLSPANQLLLVKVGTADNQMATKKVVY